MNDRFLFESLLLIRNDSRFTELRKWLDHEQEQALIVLTSIQDDRKMYSAQGRYSLLRDLKNLIDAAPEQLEKLARRKSEI